MGRRSVDHVTESHHLEAFVQDCGRKLEVKGGIEEFGVSRILDFELAGRAVKVGTNGSLYWVTAELRWDMRPDVGIMWAPENTYKRGKLLEMENEPPRTSDGAFDAVYVVVGVGSAAAVFAPRLGPSVRAALLEFADLRPDIGWLATNLKRQLHIRSEPALRTGEWDHGSTALGSDLFTPAHAAEAVRRAVQLAERIESPK